MLRFTIMHDQEQQQDQNEAHSAPGRCAWSFPHVFAHACLTALASTSRTFPRVLLSSLLVTLFASTGCAGGTPEGGGPAPAMTGTSTDRAAASEWYDRPPLYRVDGGAGADLIMLGTIHLGPAEGWSLSPEALGALEVASLLVLELDPRKINEEAVSNVVANMVMLDPPQTLESVLRPETYALLEKMNAQVSAMGLPRSVRKHMKPWFVAAGLIESATVAVGYPSSQSVEGLLVAGLENRPLIGLETFKGQLELFDNLPAELQDVMLYDTLLRLDETGAGIKQLIQAWRTTDEAVLEQIAREGIEELPELELFYDRLLNQRNRNWHTQLEPLLEDAQRADQTILVGVGALHLVGPESVLSLLSKSGYSVSRIPQTEAKP